jgi:hypothetical protein
MHLVVLESGGRVATSGAFAAVGQVLSGRVPVSKDDDGKPEIVWIGAREGAFALSLAVRKDPELASGAVLVDGGHFDDGFLEAWGRERPLMLVTPGDLVSKERGRSMAQRAKKAGLQVTQEADDAPWPVALGLAGASIRAWVEARF